MATTPEEASRLETLIQKIGNDLFDALSSEEPSVFRADWWQGRALDWAMRDPTFKVQLFRFVDVFPTLRHSDDVAEHLREYFTEESGLAGPLKTLLGAAASGGLTSSIAARMLRHNLTAMAGGLITGRDAAEALPVLQKLQAQGVGFTLDVLGEACVSEAEACAYRERYLRMLDMLPPEAATWKPNPQVDTAPWGIVPRVNVSLKLTSVYSQMDPIDREGSKRAVLEALRPIFRRAVDRGVFLNLDMEQSRYRALTYDIFSDLVQEEEFRSYPHFGIVVQAYLRDSEKDIRSLIDLAKRRGAPLTIRLVKGAYWDSETVGSAQEHVMPPVFVHKTDSDANFEKLIALMVDSWEDVRPAMGSHNIRSIATGLAAVRAAGLPDGTIEFQMLHGMAEPIKRAVSAMGLRVREYAPVGELVPGMAYLVRRLLENTANESFLRQTFAEGADRERLLAKPVFSEDATRTVPDPLARAATDPDRPGPFINETHASFTGAAQKQCIVEAIRAARSRPAERLPLLIGGRPVDAERSIISLNPSRPSEVVATVASAGTAEADQALDVAVNAFPAWRDTPVTARAAVLFRAAHLMRKRRFELAALETLEAGKTWREADADITEAIDFLEYYGREALRLFAARNLSDVPGETDLFFYEPRGVAVIIAPWNFPLAISAGMTTAALVTGCTAVYKPANATPAIGAALVRSLYEAGLPREALSYLPGPGAEIGSYLVRDPRTDVIAFTGSLETGREILSGASAVQSGQRSIKKVVCELGGKNAIIVDSDADLDAAVQGTLVSAFHYAGQKCSACSRAIVLEPLHDEFVSRVVEGARSMRVGDSSEPGTRIGPVITEDARNQIFRYIEKGESEAHLALAGEAPGHGYFVGPHVFVDVPPEATIAQEEIFGPVLSIMRARDFSHALQLAQSTRYALTGGLFSRHPGHIRQAYKEFRVGNLYVNRQITGAMVGRQPFGGSRMSGVGSKAGGPDYLMQFTEPRTVTENTLRRGFAPPDELGPM